MRLLLLINSNNKRGLIGMKAGLTEIGSAGLFHEYLQTLGINKPPLTSIDKQWEYTRNERLVAAIQIEASGQARFYLDARQISVN
ncbi:TPA: hypothetical protein RQN16_002238 [Aeromonas hydrophila]|uniref:hypothetical protein n=1 Tax=Aeromonas hydrophila TaxID=644 RepID=UPI00288F994E|nr:hypothetical protein [Aeromonas hydrophila]HDZ8851871.1 hypothetical protein [Aeromonas hydrophila]HEA3197983.1 hypothetical protein [Aeromonas hydrophila]